jgi:F1F0 ATPase subunit 2
MTSEISGLAAAFVLGATAGAMYLWALWLSVLQLSRSRHGGLWLLASAGLRIAALLAAFYWIGDGRWERLVACTLGFFAVRVVATRWSAFRMASSADPAVQPRDRCE